MKILNIKESADYLNCSISSVRKMIRNNQIEYFRIGSKINVLQEDIDKWIGMSKSKNKEKGE